MTPDPSLFIKRIRHLSQALIISGALNIGVLSMLLYWMLRERPPTPYCELKPASFEQQQIPLADQRGFTEVLSQLSQLPFSQLVERLSHSQLIENGYAERDLALASLMAFHHFDIQRALPKNAQPQQKRLLAWKPKGQDVPIPLVVYPDLTQQQFNSIIQFAKTERWPLTAEGLFLRLKEQKEKNELNADLMETFFLTSEFWTVELLFNRSGQPASKQEILTVLLEGSWPLLKQFVDQQRQVHDASDARRQKFLLDYLKAGSQSAAQLLLKTEWDFSVKKLDDQQVIAILKLMPAQLPESKLFAKEMLTSPRSTNVWRYASQWLYTQAGEPMPTPWNYQAALARFAPEKATIELVSKPPAPSPALAPPLPLARPKVTMAAPIKPMAKKGKGKASSKVASTVAMKNPTEPKKAVEPKKATELKKAMETKPRLYVVQEKDSLWKIARLFGVKVEELKAYNDLKSDTLKPGTTLKIPDVKTAPGKDNK
jgi:LysM repeat protein